MQSLIPLLCAALLVQALPSAWAGDTPPSPPAPAVAIALLRGQDVIVAWAPGAGTPDFYRVYEIVDNVPILLTTAPASETSAHVSPTGSALAVSATKGGLESPMTTAMLLGLPCITLDPTIPPDVWVGCMGQIEFQRFQRIPSPVPLR